MKTENILPDLTTPRVMAIVNVTPDSFFAGSRTPDAEAIERRVREAADAGCDLFDVGGYSSRPGAAEVTSEEEWRRVEAGVAAVRRIAPTLPVSVDTFRAEQLRRCGVRRLILDPGFGFAKTLEQNYDLLRGLHNLCSLGYPVLAGVSRKSMIYKVLDTTPDRALAGTIALGWECLRQGAAILRVHDVREAVDTVRIFKAFRP